MNDSTRLSIVGAAVRSGFAVFEKSASAGEAQREILENAWPSPDEGITKLAHLSRVLASGLLVEEAEASLVEAQA